MIIKRNAFIIKGLIICSLAFGASLAMTGTASAIERNGNSTTCRSFRLQFNDTGSCVRLAQDKLRAMGVFRQGSTGRYLSVTQQSVKDLQSRCGLPQVGYIGTQTWAALNGERKCTGNSQSGGGSTAGIPAQCLNRKVNVICMDKYGNGSRAKLWTIKANGTKTLGPVIVSTGDGRGAKYKTFEGETWVDFTSANHKSSIYDGPDGRPAPMNWSVFFSGGQAFHEGNLSASHGCVHVPAPYAKRVFDFANSGKTLVVSIRP